MKTFTALFLTVCFVCTVQAQSDLDGLQVKATAGDARAQALLGMHYRFGYKVAQDTDKASDLLQKSANQNDPIGLSGLAAMALIGHGMVKDLDKARELYSQALRSGLPDLAQSGDPLAQTYYGFILMFGLDGNKKQEEIGLEWRTKAADAGNPFAQSFLAGTILQKNPSGALKYARLAADQNFPIPITFAQYLGFDMDGAKARAEAQKGNTLVFKSLWLGMPIEDACQVINHRVGSLLVSVGTDEKSKKKSIILSKTIMGMPTSKHVEILADAEGKVSSILFSKEMLDALFETTNMPQQEFMQTFINAYDVPELESETQEIKAGFMGATSTIGWQQIYRHRSPKGYELTFFGEPRLQDDGEAMQARMMGLADYGEAGTMQLKKIKTAKERESKFD